MIHYTRDMFGQTKPTSAIEDVRARDTSHFGLIDWDFKSESSRSFIHDICWYPSRFIPIIPAQLISSLSSPGDTVLDPFCGAGTTAVEALKAGRNSVSVDLNPIACHLTQLKVNLLLSVKQETRELSQLRDHLTDVQGSETTHPQLFGQERFGHECANTQKGIPNIAENKGWYHPTTLEELSYIFHMIESLSPGILRDVARTLFISILMGSTGHRTGRSYTYYADNVKPKGELIYKDATQLFCRKLSKFLSQYTSSTFFPRLSLSASVHQGDSRNIHNVIQKKCDLIVTSPPYLGVTDYATGFRLAYLWYNFVSDLGTLKTQEIGARFRRHSKPANILKGYKRDLGAAVNEMTQVLQPYGYLCLVLGEPKRYYSEIKQYVFEFLRDSHRFRLQDSFTRQISKKFFLHPKGGVPTEEILIFRRH